MSENPFKWNWTQYKAAGRHIASFAAGSIATLATWGLLSQTDATTLTDGVQHLTTGLEEITKAIAAFGSVLVPLYTMWRAAHSASPAQQSISLTQSVPGTKVITSDEIAKATPTSPDVMSQDDVKVIMKSQKEKDK